MNTITTQDLRYTRKNVLEPRIKIDVYTMDNKHMDTIQGGLVEGSLSIAADSDVRRTITASFNPNRQFDAKIAEGRYLWIDKYVLLYIGFHNSVKDEDIWYAQGKYIFTDASITYDATNNQISINASDLVVKLNDTVNGALGQQIIEYPAYEQVFYAPSGVSYSDNCYSATITDYAEVVRGYTNKDQIGIKAPANNQAGATININGFGAIPICYKGTNTPIEADVMQAGNIYRFVIEAIYNKATSSYIYRADLTESNWEPDEVRILDENGNDYVQYIKHNLIRDALITTVTQLGRVNPNNVYVDDIGEYKGMPIKNKDWETYREETPLWNSIPYDLSFSAGCSVWSIIQEIIGLYPDYEAYFDENANFHVNMIPDCEDDETYFKDGFLNEVLVSENTSIDFTPIRNIAEVWGQVIDDVEFYADSGVSYANNTYTATIGGYDEKYYNGDLIGLRIPTTNQAGCYININGFGNVMVYDENSEQPLDANRMTPNGVYVFKIKKKRNTKTKEDELKCYLLGQWQPHGICVLTDGTVGDDYETTGGKVVKRYSKEYFQEIYNCETVGFTVIPDSPFTIQKIGERLGVYTGGEFD